MGKRKRIYLSPPDVGLAERKLLLRAFDSKWIAPVGPELDAFEEDLSRRLGIGHAVALSSGTAGLHLALVELGVGPGDEVWAPTFTFVATINPIRYVGASPVLIDSERQSWNLDPELLEEGLLAAKKKKRLPKALIAVDLFGQCANYERIEPLCEEYDVALIEDAAEALGARLGERQAGTFGQAGVLSFNGNKIITTSVGGMLVTNNGELAMRARALASQAREPVGHYEHTRLGFNYRMSNLLAAIGRAQLRRLDKFLEARRHNHDTYHQALSELSGVSLAPQADWGQPNHWLTCVLIDADRFGATPEQVRVALEHENIEARLLWKPMHQQTLYRDCPRLGGTVADELFAKGLCLPSGSTMTDSELARVVETISALCQPA
jgi:dTDP-4-amino-4,6-dideoxygalactose transaminase